MHAFFKSLMCLLLCAFGLAQAADDSVVVIGGPGVARVDAPTLQRLYMEEALLRTAKNKHGEVK